MYQSTNNISSQHGQVEIRAKAKALVIRVVPEEADTIDNMVTQFKGREEDDLVKTLRQIQEHTIASRAHLVVQKSSKLKAKAKPLPNKECWLCQYVALVSSNKSKLEQDIEAGNWQAVGAAAEQMSDQSVGEFLKEEKPWLWDAISQSPVFNRHRPSISPTQDFNLDALIKQGDWTVVISAAKSASEDRPLKKITRDTFDAGGSNMLLMPQNLAESETLLLPTKSQCFQCH